MPQENLWLADPLLNELLRGVCEHPEYEPYTHPDLDAWVAVNAGLFVPPVALQGRVRYLTHRVLMHVESACTRARFPLPEPPRDLDPNILYSFLNQFLDPVLAEGMEERLRAPTARFRADTYMDLGDLFHVVLEFLTSVNTGLNIGEYFMRVMALRGVSVWYLIAVLQDVSFIDGDYRVEDLPFILARRGHVA